MIAAAAALLVIVTGGSAEKTECLRALDDATSATARALAVFESKRSGEVGAARRAGGRERRPDEPGKPEGQQLLRSVSERGAHLSEPPDARIHGLDRRAVAPPAGGLRPRVDHSPSADPSGARPRATALTPMDGGSRRQAAGISTASRTWWNTSARFRNSRRAAGVLETEMTTGGSKP